MISETYTQYGSLHWGFLLHGKSLAFAAYHLSKAGTIRLILRVSNIGKSDVLHVSGQSGNQNASVKFQKHYVLCFRLTNPQVM
jgi:hypothetical protein